MKRYLIMTSDLRTWKPNQPMLFLGEWCRRYDLKRIWEVLDVVVADPFGVETTERNINANYVEAVADQLLNELVLTLNSYHETDHDLRYWQILLGHWIQRYVEIIFNRYSTLEKVFKNYEIMGVVAFDTFEFCFTSNDTSGILRDCREDIWNHSLYSEILNFLEIDNIELEKIKIEVDQTSKEKPKNKIVNKKLFILNLFGSFLSFFSRASDAVIVNSYLSKIEEVKLNIALGQVPQFWKKYEISEFSFSLNSRESLKLDDGKYSGFEKFVRLSLKKFIPKCYVEGYRELLEQANSTLFPKNPRFIFTSNNFDTDEIFKIWTANKIKLGTKYFVGQHGNNYGTLINYNNRPELKTSDIFLTWGWFDNNKKNIPGFLFKTIGQPKRRYQEKGGLLLIELLRLERRFHLDDSFESSIYQEDQFTFVKRLPLNIQKELTVRLSSAFKNYDWFENLRWRDFNSDIKIDDGIIRISELIKKCRIVVHSYDSTGILETLNLNIPTICFWEGGLEHLDESAKPYYELLKKVEILASSASHAASIVEKYWDDIDKWWLSIEVQEARRVFCDRYAKDEKNPIQKMKLLLTKYEN